jgi:hypothetical protein
VSVTNPAQKQKYNSKQYNRQVKSSKQTTTKISIEKLTLQSTWMGRERKALSLKKEIGQCKICLNKAIWFLKISTSTDSRLEAKTYLAVGEFLLVEGRKIKPNGLEGQANNRRRRREKKTGKASLCPG